MSRAAIYARFSTDLQRDRSIEDQIALCQRFAAQQDASVVRTYSDKAKSGASLLGREGLLSLMEDAFLAANDLPYWSDPAVHA